MYCLCCCELNMQRIREKEEIILKIEENPRRSIRSISNQMKILYSKVQRILRDESMHSYHFTYQYIFEKATLNVVWNLISVGSYCFTTTETIHSVPEFYSPSLCLREGLFNAHNLYYWAEKNPFVIRERSFQVRWKLNI